MGSKSEKLRGLSAKNWAWLELLLNYMDCRLKTKESRDSFAKSTGADHFLVWLTSALSDLSRRMPIRWFRTRGEGCGGAGRRCWLRGGGLAGAREIRRSRPQAMEFRVRVGEREAASAFPGSGRWLEARSKILDGDGGSAATELADLLNPGSIRPVRGSGRVSAPRRTRLGTKLGSVGH